MEILRNNAKAEFDGIADTDPKFAQDACQRLAIITGHSSASADNVKLDKVTMTEDELQTKTSQHQRSDVKGPVGKAPEQSTPCLELVFLPPPKKLSDNFPKPKGFSIRKECFRTLFEYLGLDYALLSYLTSSRSGWYCVRGQDGRHSFLYKDYMYTLAWTFDTKTNETRGMLAARSEFKKSKLRVTDREDDTLELPALPKDLLNQPLALAFIALADCVSYLERIIEEDGYGLGKIEGKTGYGLWVNSEESGKEGGKEAKKQSADTNLTELEQALRDIAKLIGQFLILFKSVEISQSMTQTILQAIEHPELWGAPSRPVVDEEPSHWEPWSWEEAVHLLKARVDSVNQSGKATIHRAKAMSNVVSGLISRLVARRAVADGSSMKVIALMTMLFLPATFVSALWAVPALDKEDVLTTQNFGIYWVVTIPVTLVVFIAWYVLNNDWRLLLERLQWQHGSPKQHDGPPESHAQTGSVGEHGDVEKGFCKNFSACAWIPIPRNSNQSRKA